MLEKQRKEEALNLTTKEIIDIIIDILIEMITITNNILPKFFNFGIISSGTTSSSVFFCVSF